MINKSIPNMGPVIGWLVILTTTYLASILLKIFSWESALVGFGIAFIAGGTGGLIYLFFSRNKEDAFQDKSLNLLNRLDEINNSGHALDHYIEKMKQALKGTIGESVIDYKELIRLENSVEDNSEIWIMTSALQLETDSEMGKVIRNNLKRGVIYRYLIPMEDAKVQDRMKDLINVWKTDCSLSIEKAREQIRCFLVPQHIVHMTIAIYNAKNDTPPPVVIIKLPTSQIYTKEQYPLVFCVQDKPESATKASDPFVRAFLELMNSAEGTQTFCNVSKVMDINYR